MDRTELFRHLSGIVRLATGVPVCALADDNNPAPSGSYASIEPYSSIVSRGQANQNTVGVDGGLNVSTTIERQMLVTASINFYRDNAKLYAAKLNEGNKNPNVHALLRAAGIGWSRTSAVNNLNALQSGKIEQRAQVSLMFWMEISDDPVVYNAINQVELEVQNSKGEVLQTSNYAGD